MRPRRTLFSHKLHNEVEKVTSDWHYSDLYQALKLDFDIKMTYTRQNSNKIEDDITVRYCPPGHETLRMVLNPCDSQKIRESW